MRPKQIPLRYVWMRVIAFSFITLEYPIDWNGVWSFAFHLRALNDGISVYVLLFYRMTWRDIDGSYTRKIQFSIEIEKSYLVELSDEEIEIAISDILLSE